MAFFGKAKEEEWDESFEAEGTGGGSVSGRRMKSNRNGDPAWRKVTRGKRKEPPKPWGKKERYLIFIVLLVTVIVSITLALSAREWKLPGLPRLKFPQLSLFNDETIILEGGVKDGTSEEPKFDSDKIIEEFKATTSELSGVYGVYVIDLNSGYTFGTNDKEVFEAASLIKLPVMTAMYKESEAGSLDLDSKYVLKEADKIAGSGSLYYKPAGYEITYRDLVKLMGKQSDNTAYNICKNLLGEDKINRVITSLGMVSTSMSENETSPRDVGIYFSKLWKGEVLNKSDTDELQDDMTDTSFENWLVDGVPEGVKVVHKYGREIHVVNDAGIIYAQSPYVVVIMTKGVVEREADEAFPLLSRTVYEGMTNN